MQDEIFGLVGFRSRQQAIRFHEILKRNRVNASIISTPRDVALGCGISVKIPVREFNRAKEIYRRSPCEALIGFYRVERHDGKTDIMGAKDF